MDVSDDLLLDLINRPTDAPTDDEIEAFTIARFQEAAGDIYNQNEIDWDNLDNMNLD